MINTVTENILETKKRIRKVSIPCNQRRTKEYEYHT